MTRAFARGKKALGICDRCGLTYKLDQLRTERVNLNITNLLVCPQCWDPDHPQNWQGRIDYSDPQALRNPRQDSGRTSSRWGDSRRYEFETTVQDWEAIFIETVTWADTEELKMDSGSGGGVKIELGNLIGQDIDGTVLDIVRVRYKVVTNPGDELWFGKLFWESPGGNTGSLAVDMPPKHMGDKYDILTFKLTDDPDWTPAIINSTVSLKFFTSGANVVHIDYIRFEEF
jgi:hypothetical protein